MIEQHKELVAGPVDVEKLRVCLADSFKTDDEAKPEDFGYLIKASDLYLASIQQGATVTQILQPSKFEEVIRQVFPEAEAGEVRRLAELLYEDYGYAVGKVQIELLQTDTPNEDYEKMVAAAKQAGQKIGDHAFDIVTDLLHTLCPDLRGPTPADELDKTKRYFKN